jgi:hypothetical protein
VRQRLQQLYPARHELDEQPRNFDPFAAIHPGGKEGVIRTLLAGKSPAARAIKALKPCDTEPLVRFRTVSYRLFLDKTLKNSSLSCGTAFGYLIINA